MAPKKKKSGSGKAKKTTETKRSKKSQTSLRSKKFGRQVLKASTRQTGKSNYKRDSKRKAMTPGKRRSASGRAYYEYRKNRSDVRGKRV